MKNPLVSVIIVTYHRPTIVTRCLDSVLDQTYHNLDVILINNGCKDNTAEVLDPYRSESRVRFIKFEKNIGFIGAFNHALTKIKGEWFCCISDDDTLRNDAIELMINVTKNDPEIKAVNCNSMNGETKTFCGLGMNLSQYISPAEYIGRMTGMFWGITKSNLIRQAKLPTGTPNDESIFWYRISGYVKRYYIHEALYILNTPDSGTLTQELEVPNVKLKVNLYENLVEEDDYLDMIKNYNPEKYLARCVRGFIFMKIGGKKEAKNKYKERLKEVKMDFRFLFFSKVIYILHPFFLKKLYTRLGYYQTARLLYYPVLRKYSEINN